MLLMILVVEPMAVRLGSLLTTTLAVITIATFAGLGLMRGTVTNLREQLGDSRGETKALKENRVEDREKIAQLEADLGALQRIVTGEVHWVALEDKLDVHHSEAMSHWNILESLLSQIRDELKEKP